MAEILRSNYLEELPKLLEKVKEADFICLDTNLEMNGLIKKSEKLNLKISQDNWYNFLVDEQDRYATYEVGLALYKKRPGDYANCAYDVECFNIPMLIATFEDPMKRVCKTAKHKVNFYGNGLAFMRWKKYDVNKLLYRGVPYMNEERIKEAITYIDTFPDFLSKQSKKKQYVVDNMYFPDYIPKFNSKETDKAIDRLRGISKLIDVIAETRKPVIGHNLQIKLVLLFKDLVARLPEKHSDFLIRLHQLLPEVYDTKFMAWKMRETTGSTGKFQSHCLFDLYKNFGPANITLSNFKFIGPCNDYLEDFIDGLIEDIVDDTETFCFEAGFDACVTGMVFLTMTRQVQLNNVETSIGAHKPQDFREVLNRCEMYKNVIYSYQVHKD